MSDECKECGINFNNKESIDKDFCDSCRMSMSPCIDCGASDEYQAQEKCLHCGKNYCHGNKLWG